MKMKTSMKNVNLFIESITKQELENEIIDMPVSYQSDKNYF